MKTYIYILQDPITLNVRYVGKSNNPKRRFDSHLWTKPKNTTHCYYWIKNLLNNNLKPIMTIIDETENDWEFLEKYWIEQFKQWGFKLTNLTDGGEGAYGAGQWNNEPVTAFDKEGKLIKNFESYEKCAKYFNTKRTNVSAVISGHTKLLLKKYQIKKGTIDKNIDPYINERTYTWENKPDIYWTSKSIICIEDNKEFDSITIAANYYKVKITSITNNLNRRSKKLKNGKSFKYK